MASHPSLTSANTVGNFQGSLANSGERITLTFPDQVITTNHGVVVTNTIHIPVDDVYYHDGGRWSRWADGGGSSLELVDPHSDNRLMANWATATIQQEPMGPGRTHGRARQRPRHHRRTACTRTGRR